MFVRTFLLLLLSPTATSLVVSPLVRPVLMKSTLARGAAVSIVDVNEDLAKKIDERWKFLANRNWRDGVHDIDREGAADMAEVVQARKDTALAKKDTRRWCVDRCLSTGHCDAVEDILEMTTAQVMAFCTECASLEGCELDYDMAEEIMTELHSAATDGTVTSFDTD